MLAAGKTRKTARKSMSSLKRKVPEASGSVLLETENASCEIGLFGGHILSWKVNGKEQMFMSTKAEFDGGASGNVAIRGGVPICWPQFGFFQTAAKAPGAKHGFIRCSHNWVASAVSKDSATLELVADDAMKAKWHGTDFRLVYKVSITGASLRIVLEVTNQSATEKLECVLYKTDNFPIKNDDFVLTHVDFITKRFTGCLHTYWLVNNAADCTVTGLKGANVDVGIGAVYFSPTFHPFWAISGRFRCCDLTFD